MASASSSSIRTFNRILEGATSDANTEVELDECKRQLKEALQKISTTGHDATTQLHEVEAFNDATGRVLLAIRDRNPLDFTLDDDELDIKLEIPMSEVATVFGKELLVKAFAGGDSNGSWERVCGLSLTLFEICARLGSMEQLLFLRCKAQGCLKNLICTGIGYNKNPNLAFVELLMLLRAGASPEKHHFSTLGASWPSHLLRVADKKSQCSGTALHWLCNSASILPKDKLQHFGEIAHWLCTVAPVSLLSKDANGRTPVEILMEAWTEDPLVTEKKASSSPSLPLLMALAEGFGVAADRYPLKAVELLSPGLKNDPFRKAVHHLSEMILDLAGVAINPAVRNCLSSLELFLGMEHNMREITSNEEILHSSFSAAAQVGSWNAVQDRLHLMSAVSSSASADIDKVEAIEIKARLEMCEAAHKAQLASSAERVDSLEADLSAAQRRIEELQTRNDALTAMSSRQTQSHNPSYSDRPASSASAPNLIDAEAAAESLPRSASIVPASPHEFVANLRRERLVDLKDVSDTPPEVQSGIAHLRQSLCAAVERLAEDLYDSECHFIYELVQNAEDAHRRIHVKDEAPSLRLRLFGPRAAVNEPYGYFISESNEAGFSEADVAAICDISASSKKVAKVDGLTIGCKGIGFKSVFTVSDRPHILSKGFTFVFDVLGPLGKLGYVTPTWLSQADVDSLPADVVAAHKAGRTVLYLPLKKPSLASSIEQEMLELSDPGRATLLFLRRLSRIEMHSIEKMSRVLQLQSGKTESERVIHLDVDGSSGSDHAYIVHKHAARSQDGSKLELILAFPLPEHRQTTEEAAARRLEPVFCSLPIRSLGFGFAMHSDYFELVANRAGFHTSSSNNQCIRDALPLAFSDACNAHPDIAAHAIDFVGEPVADPFWRPGREGILENLAGVQCVSTDTGSRKPTEVLLRGSGVLTEVANLLPSGLLLASCGKVFAENMDATKERLLRRLGTQEFSLTHLCNCLAHKGGQWPDGWVASMWKTEKRRAVVPKLNTLYKCLAAKIFDSSMDDDKPIPMDTVLSLLKMPIMPTENGSCIAPSDSKIFRGYCPDIDGVAQWELARASVISIVPDIVVKALDISSCKLLDALGVQPPTAIDLAKAALEVHLCFKLEQKAVSDEERISIRTSVAVLSEIWLASSPGDQHAGVLQEAFKRLGLIETVRLPLDDERCTRILSSTVLLCGRDGRLSGPRCLICPTLFGAESTLAPDIRLRIDKFLGFSALTMQTHDSSAEMEFVDFGAWENKLELETFLIDALKVSPLSPMDARQPRVAPDLMLSLASALGKEESLFWRAMIDHEKTPQKVRKYVVRRLQSKADCYWLGQLAVRAGVSRMLCLRELFLRSAFFPVVGGALEKHYLDLPEVETAGRGAEIRQVLKGLGVQCEMNIQGATAAVLALQKASWQDAAAYAKLYGAISSLEEDVAANNIIDDDTALALRSSIFHPEDMQLVCAPQCIWTAPKGTLLSHCINVFPLEGVYKSFGASRMERYFAARGVPTKMNSAADYLNTLNHLLNAAEDLGRKWREANDREHCTVSCGRMAMLSATFLEEVWPALLEIYKGMAALPAAERAALKPFSTREARIVVPLRCPEGGPPANPSMLLIAYFHDGAIFRRLSVGESFWEVSLDLAHSPAADWALTSFFPAELRDLFVEEFGVRACVDKAALRSSQRKAQQRPPGSFGFGENRDKSVNESGLPDDILGSGGDRGRKGVMDSMMQALDCLRRGTDRGRETGSETTSSTRSALVAPAAPARSVRCPATQAKLLFHGGEIKFSCGSSSSSSSSRSSRCAVPIYVAEEEKLRHVSEAGEKAVKRAQRDLASFAKLLWKLAEEVFEVPGSCVALVVDGSAQQDGCSHQSDNLSWPLLFSVRLHEEEVGGDPFFWFGEFCHALAHRSEGADYSAQHARVMQALASKHLSRFQSVFSHGSSSMRSRSTSKGKRRRVTSRSQSRSRGRSRGRSRRRSRTRSRSRSAKRRRR